MFSSGATGPSCFFSWPSFQHCCWDKIPDSDYIKEGDCFDKTLYGVLTTTACQEYTWGLARCSRRSEDWVCTGGRAVLASWRIRWPRETISLEKKLLTLEESMAEQRPAWSFLTLCILAWQGVEKMWKFQGVLALYSKVSMEIFIDL